MKNKVLKNALVIIVIFIVLVLVYGIFFSGTLDNKISTSIFSSFLSGQSADLNDANQGVLTILQSVKNINLDDSVFGHPAFETLIDKSIVLPTVDVIGRVDIFFPLGTASSATSVARGDESGVDSEGTGDTGSIESDQSSSDTGESVGTAEDDGAESVPVIDSDGDSLPSN